MALKPFSTFAEDELIYALNELSDKTWLASKALAKPHMKKMMSFVLITHARELSAYVTNTWSPVYIYLENIHSSDKMAQLIREVQKEILEDIAKEGR